MKYPNGGTTYTKLTTIIRPTEKFVVLDEKGDLINDGALYVDCSVSGDTLYDVPGNYHNTGTVFNYADGHSDVHRWKDPQFLQRHGPRHASWPKQPRYAVDKAACLGVRRREIGTRYGVPAPSRAMSEPP